MCILIAATALAGASTASSMTDLYQLAQSSGSGTDMTGSSTIFGSYYSYNGSGQYSIGFNFKFDNATYSTFSVNASGLMTLGQNTPPPYYS